MGTDTQDEDAAPGWRQPGPGRPIVIKLTTHATSGHASTTRFSSWLLRLASWHMAAVQQLALSEAYHGNNGVKGHSKRCRVPPSASSATTAIRVLPEVTESVTLPRSGM